MSPTRVMLTFGIGLLFASTTDPEILKLV